MVDETNAPSWEDLAVQLAEARKEIERLRKDCPEANQVMGCVLIGDPFTYSDRDAERALDNIFAAANGDPRPHEDLLPWPLTEVAA